VAHAVTTVRPSVGGYEDNGERPCRDDDHAALRDDYTVRAAEVLRDKDFQAYDDAELAEAHRLMARLRVTGSPRRSLRLRAAPRGRPDLRRTLRAAMQTDGEAVYRRYRAPAAKYRHGSQGATPPSPSLSSA